MLACVWGHWIVHVNTFNTFNGKIATSGPSKQSHASIITFAPQFRGANNHIF